MTVTQFWFKQVLQDMQPLLRQADRANCDGWCTEYFTSARTAGKTEMILLPWQNEWGQAQQGLVLSLTYTSCQKSYSLLYSSWGQEGYWIKASSNINIPLRSHNIHELGMSCFTSVFPSTSDHFTGSSPDKSVGCLWKNFWHVTAYYISVDAEII